MMRLIKGGYEANIVGGAVRDCLLGQVPRDWDIASNAKPSEVIPMFKKTLPTGIKYGTVTVRTHHTSVQVTTYRTDARYSDGRHPEGVTFVAHLEDDLSRRDFTINSMAMDRNGTLLDPFRGARDLKKRCLRTVGSASDRFGEDALRMIRAGRFIAQLNVKPVPTLSRAAKRHAPRVDLLSSERIRDELVKLLISPSPGRGLRWLDGVGILSRIIPELSKGRGVRQGGWHHYDVFRHTLEALDGSVPILEVRLALLFHDIAKPQTRTRDKGRYRFIGHERKGAEIAEETMRRFRFPNQLVEDVRSLVLFHLFEDRALAKSDGAIRRFLRKLGERRLDWMLDLRRADIRACGPGHRVPPTLAAIQRRARSILQAREAISLRDLRVGGSDIMRWLKIPAGPKVGEILRLLLDEVIEHPELNKKTILKKRVVFPRQN